MKRNPVIFFVTVGGFSILLFFFFFLNQDEVAKQNSESIDEETEVSEEKENEEGGETVEEYPNPPQVSPQVPVFIEVTQGDCQNECQAFSGNEEKLGYCRSYCGFSAREGEVSPMQPCDEKSSVERDSCIKDEAVREKNIERCEDIHDQNLKKSCQARVTEEYFP